MRHTDGMQVLLDGHPILTSGPSLAAALTGFTPAYGLHLDENRRPTLTVRVEAQLTETVEFGALGKAIGEQQAIGQLCESIIVGNLFQSVLFLK